MKISGSMFGMILAFAPLFLWMFYEIYSTSGLNDLIRNIIIFLIVIAWVLISFRIGEILEKEKLKNKEAIT